MAPEGSEITMRMQDAYMGHTEKTTEEHPLVLNGGYRSFAVRHCFRLKIGWEIDKGSNKSVNGACELLRRLRVVNKHWAHIGSETNDLYSQRTPTVVPGSGCDTNDLSLVFMVVYNGANTQTHHRQWRRILRCTVVRLGKGIYVLWI